MKIKSHSKYWQKLVYFWFCSSSLVWMIPSQWSMYSSLEWRVISEFAQKSDLEYRVILYDTFMVFLSFWSLTHSFTSSLLQQLALTNFPFLVCTLFPFCLSLSAGVSNPFDMKCSDGKPSDLNNCAQVFGTKTEH